MISESIQSYANKLTCRFGLQLVCDVFSAAYEQQELVCMEIRNKQMNATVARAAYKHYYTSRE